jgi:isoleucyl-tRNA synthetase
LKRTADAYRRIRNTARYLLGSLHGFDPAADSVPLAEMVAIDRRVISVAATTQAQIRAAYGNREFHKVYQLLHNFCVNDLGSLYLDHWKDRLYTTPERSITRRSAQTAIHHLIEALVRWITPILSFTADEIWRLLPGQRTESVFQQAWWAFPAELSTRFAWEGYERGVQMQANWGLLDCIRDLTRLEIETLRAAGEVGSSLQASVTIEADLNRGSCRTEAALASSELRFFLMTSQAAVIHCDMQELASDMNAYVIQTEQDQTGATVYRPYKILTGSAAGELVRIHVRKTEHPKCERCWHYCDDVGHHPGHETICGRCVLNLRQAGEQRRWF